MKRNNENLKAAKIYYENGTPYMKLVYEYNDEEGVHEVTYPKVQFPFETDCLPNVTYEGFSFDVSFNIIIPHDELILFKGSAGGFDEVYFIDKITKPKFHEMTIEEIEKKLGYPVKIVSEKKENDDA